MESEEHPLSYWFILIGAFAGGAAFILFAVALILQILNGHGSQAGNILRVALAVFSLFVGLFCVTVGTLYRLSFNDAR
jgi:predicted CDP-diglyceride synthetase/phosphatidate cytidylyltransferase